MDIIAVDNIPKAFLNLRGRMKKSRHKISDTCVGKIKLLQNILHPRKVAKPGRLFSDSFPFGHAYQRHWSALLLQLLCMLSSTQSKSRFPRWCT